MFVGDEFCGKGVCGCMPGGDGCCERGVCGYVVREVYVVASCWSDVVACWCDAVACLVEMGG